MKWWRRILRMCWRIINLSIEKFSFYAMQLWKTLLTVFPLKTFNFARCFQTYMMREFKTGSTFHMKHLATLWWIFKATLLNVRQLRQNAGSTWLPEEGLFCRDRTLNFNENIVFALCSAFFICSKLIHWKNMFCWKQKLDWWENVRFAAICIYIVSTRG